MTDPGISLFQGEPIEIDNQQPEEDEDLEEHNRRQAELTDLLAAGIGAFNYDESTLDSSTTSVEAPEAPQTPHDSASHSFTQQYKHSRPQDQLQILYEVRCREVHALREELAQEKAATAKEINTLKNKLAVSEAEIRQLQLSSTSLESLLVEKSELVSSLNRDVSNRDQEVAALRREIEQLNRDICSYSSTVSELQLKLASDHHPFGGAKNPNAPLIQKSHQDQVLKLETQLQEQRKSLEIIEKENSHLKNDIKKLAQAKSESDNENNETIMRLSKKLQVCQQQCKDLFILGEAIKKESDHFKQRMMDLETGPPASDDSFLKKSLDKDSLVGHCEKLKRLLLDRDIEINSLQAKLKFYHSDLQELFEYRKIVENVYNSEMKACSNTEHGELLVFMQRQLQSYEQAVEDRNQQILNLNAINKELQEKIEGMLQQTRTDIQNLSQRYSLPQLEALNEELKKAELENEKLAEKLQDANDEIESLRNDMLKPLKEELTKSETEIAELKRTVDAFREEKPSDDNKSDGCGVGSQLRQVAEKLEKMSTEQEFTEVIKFVTELTNKIEDVFNRLNGVEFVNKDELKGVLMEWHKSLIDLLQNYKNSKSASLFNFKYDSDLQEKIDELESAQRILENEKSALEHQIEALTKHLRESQDENNILKENNIKLFKETSNNVTFIKNLTEELATVKESLKLVEAELEQSQKELKETKLEIIQLQKDSQIDSSKSVRRSLFQELKETPDESENMQKLLKLELNLRDNLEAENLARIAAIEDQYKQILTEETEKFNQNRQKWKNQEATYRNQFAAVLEECSRKMSNLELENEKSSAQIQAVLKEHQEFKKSVSVALGKYQSIIFESKCDQEKMVKMWDELLHFIISNYSTLAQKSCKQRNSITKKISNSQKQVDQIEKQYETKLRKLRKKSVF